MSMGVLTTLERHMCVCACVCVRVPKPFQSSVDGSEMRSSHTKDGGVMRTWRDSQNSQISSVKS